MVNTSYYFNIITENGIPLRCEFIKDGCIVGTSSFDDSDSFRQVNETNEYIAEYNNCEVFIYTDRKTNEIIKKSSLVVYLNNNKDGMRTYTPKKSITYS